VKKRKPQKRARKKAGLFAVKRIMCPIDFSEVSLKALHDATALAGYFDADLFVIHVVQPVSTIGEEAHYSLYDFDAPRYEDSLLKDARKRLKNILEKELSRRFNVHTQVQPGDPSRVIVKSAAKKHIDLIVMSPHGVGRLRYMLFGSVAEKVIHTAPCPVLIIRGPEEKEEL
jgi:universal stress protein A